ncbi:adenosylcobinamide-phosphate synthase CbiB [Lysinibacillus louembei]|uniref:Cobalamin biosynthesis protein CobD n=1 Tax=Lysinibacillus louembei TaxID=1470088 RepID=A0ABZ0RWH7_9BACI|nr:adenosylcobinamide-phosphate synthase CbiB [Lysinibacillus louembei]WPK11391.1 adenosylcobinamide-phosphate synthase CbiB [Lysinibacillus louembei]
MNIVIVAIAILLDRLVGDPPRLPHPVIWIGKLISFFEQRWNHGTAHVLKGAMTAIFVVSLTGIIVWGLIYLAGLLSVWLAVALEILLIAIAIAQKSLKDAAMVVYDALRRGDMQEARIKLGWIVGRDTAHLEEPEIVRGVVETVSENTSDGITAPIFYALLFGATGAWVYKAINTLDSMIGYRNERYGEFGRFAARLDDVANFIPSRLTGLCILLFTKNEGTFALKERLCYWLRDAKKHPSPNSGYLEAATALQLGIRLGGENTYQGKTSFRAYMGEPIVELSKVHILRAIQHLYAVTILFTLLIGGMMYAISRTWS